MEKMIDIHSHLIPQFDDGPRSFEESLDMLKLACDQGITDVFATSHFNEYIPAELEKEYFQKLKRLQKKAEKEKLQINIHSGAEIFYHHYVEETVKKSKVATMGNWGQYVLIEFPMFQMPSGAENILFRLIANNYIPIVSHPERYTLIIDRPRKARIFCKFGGLLQINGGSVLGHFGKEIRRTSMALLEQRLVHFIASDAHLPYGRTFILKQVYEFLKNDIEKEYLNELLFENPLKIIQKDRIENTRISEEKKFGYLKLLKNRLKMRI
jgi:protein-tyrosine phosphatase